MINSFFQKNLFLDDEVLGFANSFNGTNIDAGIPYGTRIQNKHSLKLTITRRVS